MERRRERERKKKKRNKKKKEKKEQQTDRQTTDRQNKKQTDRKTDKQKERQSRRQTTRQKAKNQKERKNERQKKESKERHVLQTITPNHQPLWMFSPLLQPPDAYTPPFECPAPRPTAETEDLTRRESQVGSDRAAAETMMDIKDGKTGERRAVIRIGSSATSFLSPGRGGQTSPGQGCQLGPNHRLGRKDRSTMPVLQKRREVRAASATLSSKMPNVEQEGLV